MRILSPNLILLLLFSTVSTALMAQNGDIDILKSNAAIFRGPVKESYPYYITGTPYFEKGEFERTSLKYNKKWYHNVELNLDLCRDELCVRVPETYIIITLDRTLTNEFSISGHKFIFIGDNTVGTQNKFCEVIHDGNSSGIIIKEQVKKYARTEDKVSIAFYPIIKHYILKGDNAYRIRGVRTFKKVYPQYKKEIRKCFRHLDYTDKEFLYTSLMHLIDNLEHSEEEAIRKGGDL